MRKNLYLPVETIYLYISIYLAVASNRVFKVINFQHRAFKEQKKREKLKMSEVHSFTRIFVVEEKCFCTFVMNECMSDTKDKNTAFLDKLIYSV